jgi:DegV family protein with EDD domain
MWQEEDQHMHSVANLSLSSQRGGPLVKVHVVTDSAADILPKHAHALGLTVVPNRVMLDGQVYRDGLDLTPTRFFIRLPYAERMPHTEPASPQDLYAAYTAALRRGATAVVAIHVSSQLSRVVAHAQAAWAQLAGAPIYLIDSLQAGIGMWPAVIEAANLARLGARADDVQAIACTMLERTRVYFLVETLEYLRRSGRIGRASAVVGTLLDARPILTIEEGEVAVVETVRPRARALLRLRELVLGEGPLSDLIVCGSSSEGMDQVVALLQEQYAGSIQKAWLGPTLGANVGPLVGVAAVQR